MSPCASVFKFAYVFICVYFWPPVRAVCQYHEVVVLHPFTGNTLDLGSIANYTFYSSPPDPPVSTVFLDLFIYPLYPTAPPSVAFVTIAPLSCICPPPPLLARNAVHLEFVSTRHPPAYADQLCTLSCVPASSAVSRVHSNPIFRPRNVIRYL